jgi:predicted GNAT superfamily acetyltransferase
MSIQLRDAVPADYPAVQALNDAAVPAVTPATVEHIARIAAVTAYFRVAVENGEIAGFLTAMTPDSAYWSPNFRWFADRYDSFVYVDRIVVDPSRWRGGIGGRFYADIEAFARPLASRVTCEVNTRPRNDVSLNFHARCGFREVGTLASDNGNQEVVLLEKTLT